MTIHWKRTATQLDMISAMLRIRARGYRYTVEDGGRTWRVAYAV